MIPQAGTSSLYDVIVIGAGAAGMMCAFVAGQRERKVLLLEHNERPGLKIAISGGGRCNFTNIDATPDNYLSGNPDFCRSAMARYTPWDFIALVEKHGIRYHEKKLGQQFCDTSSRHIIEMLVAECAAGGVETRYGCRVEEVTRGETFRVATTHGVFASRTLVIATGGLSFPKLGATDFGYRIARQFGIRIIEPRPGLVPFTCGGAEQAAFDGLSGLSLPVAVRHRGAAFEEALLFTHRGLSGPAILQISSYWQPGETVHFDLLPGQRAAEILAPHRQSRAELPSLLGQHWPRRFAEAWCARHTPAKQLQHWKAREIAEVQALLHAWPVTPSGTEGYAKAEVTMGGVDTSELSSRTMEARRVPGLYFIGEVVDVTGWLGGYNFQWAWAGGYAAGQAL